MESTWDLTLHDKARVTKEILSDAVGEDVSKWERPQDFGEGSKKVWPPGTTEAVGCNWLNLEDKLYLLCDGRSEKWSLRNLEVWVDSRYQARTFYNIGFWLYFYWIVTVSWFCTFGVREYLTFIIINIIIIIIIVHISDRQENL